MANYSAGNPNKISVEDMQERLLYGESPQWGDETNTDEGFNAKILTALNWANAMLSPEALKQEVLEFCRKENIETNKIETAPEFNFAAIGKLAWLSNNGCPIFDHWRSRIFLKVQDILNSEDMKNDDVEVEEKKISKTEIRQYNLLKRTDELMAYLENEIDEMVLNKEDINESKVYQKLVNDSADEKAADSAKLILKDRHSTLVTEFNALESMDEESIIVDFDDRETYEKYVSDIEDNINSLVIVLNQISSFLGNKKLLKKSERKGNNKFKAKRIETQVQNVNFKVQDSTFKVTSINPVAIVGSQTLLVFNTKTRKLSVYCAKDDVGLSIKGTTIQNFDEEKSFQKIIKKPAMISQMQEAIIRRVCVLLDGVKAKESSVTGRLNDQSILLKTFKEKFSR